MRIIFAFTEMFFGYWQDVIFPLDKQRPYFKFGYFCNNLISIFIKKTVGIYRWSSVFWGRLGILLLTAPFSGTNSYSIIYGLLAAISIALLSVALRRFGEADQSLSVAFIYSFFSCLINDLPINIEARISFGY